MFWVIWSSLVLWIRPSFVKNGKQTNKKYNSRSLHLANALLLADALWNSTARGKTNGAQARKHVSWEPECWSSWLTSHTQHHVSPNFFILPPPTTTKSHHSNSRREDNESKWTVEGLAGIHTLCFQMDFEFSASKGKKNRPPLRLIKINPVLQLPS